MSLSLQPQRSQRGCAGDGQPYCPPLSLQPQQHPAPICRSHCSRSAPRGAVQEMVSLIVPRSPCSHSNILLLYVALTAAAALPEGLCRRWSALLSPALPAATATSCSYMSLSLQPQRSQRGCAGDGQPYCPPLS